MTRCCTGTLDLLASAPCGGQEVWVVRCADCGKHLNRHIGPREEAFADM